MATIETLRPAFPDTAASKLAYTNTTSTLSTPNVSYGLPFPEACAKHIRETFKASRVYIICSGTLSRKTKELERLVDAIGEKNVVGVRKGMAQHTLWPEIIDIANEAKSVQADCLVTLGAGSLTDGAKIVALAIANNISTTAELSRYSVEASNPPKDVKPPTVPLICIPTSLSGGEYFSLAGGTDDSTHHKHAFLHPGMGAKLVILDAELCVSTPAIHWLSTGVRSVDHCVETICSLESAPANEDDAEAGLRLLVPWLLVSRKEEGNVQARHECQMGVISAMKSIRAGVPMGGSHAIGHQLGPLGVGHGITSCVMCPAVMKWNAKHGISNPIIRQKQEKIRKILWSEKGVAEILKAGGLDEEKADLGDILDTVIRTLGLPRTLKEVGIGRDRIPALAERTLHDAWAKTNPVPLTTTEQVAEILEMVAE